MRPLTHLVNAGTIVHPKATIFAIAGPIVIGSGCIIEEGAIIVNRSVLSSLARTRIYNHSFYTDARKSCASATTTSSRSAVVSAPPLLSSRPVPRSPPPPRPLPSPSPCPPHTLFYSFHHHTLTRSSLGVESPTVGNCNTVCTRARVHHTLRISSYCVIGAGVLVVPTEDEMLDEYTTIYGPAAERRVWSGRGKVQEMDLRRKHADYLREMLPKFNRLRRGDGA